MSASMWRRLRQATQALTLALFVYLMVTTRAGGWAPLPRDLFFRLDPLAGASTMLAGRHWVLPLALGALTLLLAVAAGRVWCGWLCPLGTLLDWTPSRRAKSTRPASPSAWRQAKHYVLFTLLVAAALGSLALLVLDPITLLFRSLASVVLPVLDSLIGSVESALYHVGPLRGPIESFDHFVQGSVLPLDQPFLWQNLLVAAAFVGVLALNAVRPRFWCRYICPLGALLALASKIAWFRQHVDELACNECGRCARACPTGAIDPRHGFSADPAECTMCLDCLDACPKGGVSFKGTLGPAAWRRYDPSRRQAIASLAVAAAGVGLMRFVPPSRKPHPLSIRPPGTDEATLLSRCIRCAECVKVCPTGGLQPGLTTSGWEGLWTPVLVPRIGYCDYSCTACGQVCPTEAIPRLSLEEKRRAVIGIAYIDEKRCIPYAEGRECIVCEEMCPMPKKAVLLEERTVVDRAGHASNVRCPRVVEDRCIGCGICERQCPLNGEAAIRIRLSPNTKTST